MQNHSNEAGRPNIGPVSLGAILKRRGVSYADWCLQEGISTRSQFETYRIHLESKGEFFIPEDLIQFAANHLGDPPKQGRESPLVPSVASALILETEDTPAPFLEPTEQTKDPPPEVLQLGPSLSFVVIQQEEPEQEEEKLVPETTKEDL